MYLCTRKNWLYSGSLDPDLEIFLRILQHCEIGHFPQFDLYLSKNWSNLHENFIFVHQKVPIKFWKSSRFGLDSPWWSFEWSYYIKCLAKYYYARQRCYVRFVCLFFCLLATLRKNYWMDLHKNFTTDVSVHKEELIKFWESFASGSRNFLKHSSILQDRAFYTIWFISLRESDWIWWKFYHRCILEQGSPC